MPKSATIKAESSIFGGDRAMSLRRAATLWCCLAAVPLLGCAGGVAVGPQETSATAIAVADNSAAPDLHPRGADQPVAILVLLPGAGAFGSDPALWTNEGFAIVTPPPTALYQLAAAQEAALAQELAAARRLTDAPIWLLGPSREIEVALAAPGSGRERVSGLVVTSPAAAGVCSESFFYFDPGTGANPQVMFSKSGNCPPGAGFGSGGRTITPAPAIRPAQPRIIEAEAAPANTSPTAQRAAVTRLAALIKAS
jgi:hypothetical protein